LEVPKENWDSITLMRGRGCEKCNFSGYKGRTAIHEMLVMNEVIREMVLDERPHPQLKEEPEILE